MKKDDNNIVKHISEIKTAIDKVPLKRKGTNDIYLFSFPIGKVKITDEDGFFKEYIADVKFTDTLILQIGADTYTINSFIQDGQLLLNLNNGQIILKSDG